MTYFHRTWIAVVAIVATLCAAITLAPGASAGPLNRADRTVASGIHFDDLHPADVIGGKSNDLLIQWTAGRALTDGTVRITFPSAQWSTPLHSVNGILVSHMPPGAFSVRPYGDIPVDPAVPSPACDALPGSEPPPFAVEDIGGDQVIVISHVTCAPGQSLAVLVEGVHAPAATGPQVTHADLPITAADAGSTRHSVARVPIMPTPRIRLQVASIPAEIEAGVPFQVEIQALRPDGGPARHYLGTVALASSDCTMEPNIDSTAAHFTAADKGSLSIEVTLNISNGPTEAHQLHVYDIANKAQPGVSNDFDVVGSPPQLSCPVGYH